MDEWEESERERISSTLEHYELRNELRYEKDIRNALRGGMVKLKVVISFKRLQVIFIHSYGSSIAPKMTF